MPIPALMRRMTKGKGEWCVQKENGMAGTVTVLCADGLCKHNFGGGYYGVCQHPANKDKVPYCGIDRYYMETCKLRERDTGGASEIPDEIPMG